VQQLSDLESRIQKLRQRASTKGRFLFKKSGSNLTPSQKKALDPEPVTKEQEAAAVADKPLQSSQTQRKRNEYITSATLADDIKTPSEVTLTDLDGCVVDFLERPLSSDARPSPVRTALHVNDICNSVLVLGKVDGSAMLHNIERCTIVLKCHQLRIHNSKNLIIYLEVPSDSSAVIESCSGVTFANIPSDLGLVPSSETNEVPATRPIVQDFSHIMSSTSPNWRFIEDDGVARCRFLKNILNEQSMTPTDLQVVLEDLLPPPT